MTTTAISATRDYDDGRTAGRRAFAIRVSAVSAAARYDYAAAELRRDYRGYAAVMARRTRHADTAEYAAGFTDGYRAAARGV